MTHDNDHATGRIPNVQGHQRGRGRTLAALETNGTPACWGDDGQDQSSPPSDKTFKAISAGYAHTCALEDNGTPVCWGSKDETTTTGLLHRRTRRSLRSAREKYIRAGSKTTEKVECWGGKDHDNNQLMVPARRDVQSNQRRRLSLLRHQDGRLHNLLGAEQLMGTCWTRPGATRSFRYRAGASTVARSRTTTRRTAGAKTQITS